MSVFAVAALISIATGRPVGDLSAPVTYDTRAARAERVVADLARIGNVDLQTSPQTKNEVLVVSVKDIPLIEVLKRIATVTSGEWKQEGSVYRLIASESVRTQEDRKDQAQRVAGVVSAIAARVKQEKDQAEKIAKAEKDMAAKQKADAAKTDKGDKSDKGDKGDKGDKSDQDDTADANMAEMLGGAGGMLQEGTITDLLQHVDPAAIAAIDDGERVVFSSNPTRTQRAFNGNVVDILNTFIVKHDDEIAKRAEPSQDDFDGLTQEQADQMRAVIQRQNKKIGQASKALLIFSKNGLGIITMNQVELRIYNPKGEVAFSQSTTLSTGGDDDMAAMMAAVMKKPEAAPTVKETPIELSDDSTALVNSTKRLASGNYSLKFSPDLHKKLFRPDLFDPLSFEQTDEVLAYAKSKGKPLVADIPDSSYESFAFAIGSGEPKTIEGYGRELAKGKTIVKSPDEAFTLLMPANPTQSRADRLDRFALTKLLAAGETKELVSMDDMAQFAVSSPNPMANGISQMYVILLVPGGFEQNLGGMTNWDLLRFYGRLTPDERLALSNSGRLALSSLSEGQRGDIERMTYGSQSHLEVSDPTRKKDEQPSFMSMFGGNAGIDYRDEPTEVVPNGLPPDGFVDLKLSTEPFASPVMPDGGSPVGILAVMDAESLAMFRMFKEDKNYASMSGSMPSFNKLRIGERSVLAFTVHLTPQVTEKGSLHDNKLAKDARVASDSSLPDDLQKLVNDKLAELKKSPFGMAGSIMGGMGNDIHP